MTKMPSYLPNMRSNNNKDSFSHELSQFPSYGNGGSSSSTFHSPEKVDNSRLDDSATNSSNSSTIKKSILSSVNHAMVPKHPGVYRNLSSDDPEAQRLQNDMQVTLSKDGTTFTTFSTSSASGADFAASDHFYMDPPNFVLDLEVRDYATEDDRNANRSFCLPGEHNGIDSLNGGSTKNASFKNNKKWRLLAEVMVNSMSESACCRMIWLLVICVFILDASRGEKDSMIRANFQALRAVPLRDFIGSAKSSSTTAEDIPLEMYAPNYGKNKKNRRSNSNNDNENDDSDANRQNINSDDPAVKLNTGSIYDSDNPGLGVELTARIEPIRSMSALEQEKIAILKEKQKEKLILELAQQQKLEKQQNNKNDQTTVQDAQTSEADEDDQIVTAISNTSIKNKESSLLEKLSETLSGKKKKTQRAAEEDDEESETGDGVHEPEEDPKKKKKEGCLNRGIFKSLCGDSEDDNTDANGNKIKTVAEDMQAEEDSKNPEKQKATKTITDKDGNTKEVPNPAPEKDEYFYLKIGGIIAAAVAIMCFVIYEASHRLHHAQIVHKRPLFETFQEAQGYDEFDEDMESAIKQAREAKGKIDKVHDWNQKEADKAGEEEEEGSGSYSDDDDAEDDADNQEESNDDNDDDDYYSNQKGGSKSASGKKGGKSTRGKKAEQQNYGSTDYADDGYSKSNEWGQSTNNINNNNWNESSNWAGNGSSDWGKGGWDENNWSANARY